MNSHVPGRGILPDYSLESHNGDPSLSEGIVLGGKRVAIVGRTCAVDKCLELKRQLTDTQRQL